MNKEKLIELEKLRENVLITIDNLVDYAGCVKDEVNNFYDCLRGMLKDDNKKLHN